VWIFAFPFGDFKVQVIWSFEGDHESNQQFDSSKPLKYKKERSNAIQLERAIKR
jgi:hypothetical protein